jgi:uncharacterized protein YbjT (DUF2867 family)
MHVPTIAVLTASSASGAACVDTLLLRYAGRAKVRAIFRTEAKAAALRASSAGNDDIDIVVGVDATLPETIVTALQGTDVAFLVTPAGPTGDMSDMSQDAGLVANMMSAAAEAGVKHIVFGGSWTVNVSEEVKIIAARFAPGEAQLKRLEEEKGITWTVLRGGFFCGNLPHMFGSLKAGNKLMFPDLTLPPVDVDDIGRVAAAVGVARGVGHSGKAYEISGPERLSSGEMCGVLAKVLGRDLELVPVPIADYTSKLPLPLQELMLYLAEKGEAAVPLSQDVEAITGEKAISFEKWAVANKSAFPLLH